MKLSRVGLTGLLVLLLATICAAQAAPKSTATSSEPARVVASAAQKLDPAKETDIKQLLEVSGAKIAMVQVMSDMEKNMRPMLANYFPPGDYRDHLIDLFFEKFHSKADPQKMLELAVPVYDKYLSDDDIRGLIQFYSTPLGKKAVSALPRIMTECAAAGRQMGEQLGRDSMMEVLQEHPDLQKALEDAGKKAQAQP